MDGKLPIVNDVSISNPHENNTHAEGSRVFYSLNESSPDTEKCFLGNGRVIFWLGQFRSSNGSWSNPYNPAMNFDHFHANSPPSFKCTYMFGPRAEAASCDSKFPCGYCLLPPGKTLYMKGLCAGDIESLYDVQYYLHGSFNGRPYLRLVST
jgi:hypothetical protein